LDQLADARADAVHWIVSGWQEGTNLIASRTQLRASLAAAGGGGDAETTARVRGILEDALSAAGSVSRLDVYDADGRPVASVTRDRGPAPGVPQSSAPAVDGAAYFGVSVRQTGAPLVSFAARLTVDGTAVGSLVAVFRAPELWELTENHSSLGATGETLIFWRDRDGSVRTLHPTRHGDRAATSVVVDGGPESLARRALDGPSALLTGGVFDYRGEEVWAATRSLADTGWGLVVKMDREEAAEPALEFQDWLSQTALILAAFTIVLGLVLALRFALPIHGLAEVARRIGKGEMDARADGAREDEVGLLARTFNDMADELEQRMEQLHEFRKFFDVTIDLMCIAGTDGYFKLTNPAFERELGWSQDELLSRPFYDLVHPEDLAKTEHEVAKLADGIPTISFENRFLCKDGSYTLLRWTSYPEGGVLYAIAHVLDHSPAA
jgi:PAS domain S-box-containing protein